MTGTSGGDLRRPSRRTAATLCGPERTPVTQLGRTAHDYQPGLEEAAHLPGDPQQWQEEITKVALLSTREFEVLCLLGTGVSNRRIARQLRITERTVKAHVARIMAKLGVESRLQAGLVAYVYHLPDDYGRAV